MRGNGSRIGFGFDLPLMMDLSVGAGSSHKAESIVGGFIGAGFGLTHANQKYTYTAPGWANVKGYKGTSYGPVVHTGFRYAHYKWDFTIRVFYKKGLEEQKFQTFGIHGALLFNGTNFLGPSSFLHAGWYYFLGKLLLQILLYETKIFHFPFKCFVFGCLRART